MNKHQAKEFFPEGTPVWEQLTPYQRAAEVVSHLPVEGENEPGVMRIRNADGYEKDIPYGDISQSRTFSAIIPREE